MLTRKDLNEVMQQVFKECGELREAGQKEYAHKEDNALRNFEALASELNLTREQVLWVYVRKHIDGITAYINGHKSQREDVRGRINDSIVYLCILRAMVEDTEQSPARAAVD